MVRKRLVYVEWIDSSELYGWTSPTRMLDENLMCFSVGWLVEESDDRIVLGSSISYVAAPDIKTTGTLGIPKVCVVKMHTLKIPATAKVWK